MARKGFHFFNMYLTATVSVALVLVLVGIEAIIGISARDLVKQVKENLALMVVLNDNTTDEQTQRIDNMLQISSYVRDYRYISKDEALQEHIQALGEDPSDFLGFNPLFASYEIKLNEQYAQIDSIKLIEQRLSTLPFVDKIVYQKDVVQMLDNNVSQVSKILLAVALVLLFIAIVLVVNTIRLHVYSKRFLINTMKLVGATSFVIKRPIVAKHVWLGVFAAFLAIAMLAFALWYCQTQLGVALLILSWQNITFVAGVVLLFGILLTFFASVFAVNRYIRMKTNDLYFL